MKTLDEKEKKLKESIEKLNLIKTEDPNLQNSILNLDKQKNQLEIEKKELENKYLEIKTNYDLSLIHI